LGPEVPIDPKRFTPSMLDFSRISAHAAIQVGIFVSTALRRSNQETSLTVFPLGKPAIHFLNIRLIFQAYLNRLPKIE